MKKIIEILPFIAFSFVILFCFTIVFGAVLSLPAGPLVGFSLLGFFISVLLSAVTQ